MIQRLEMDDVIVVIRVRIVPTGFTRSGSWSEDGEVELIGPPILWGFWRRSGGADATADGAAAVFTVSKGTLAAFRHGVES